MTSNITIAGIFIFAGFLFHRYNVKALECQKLRIENERLKKQSPKGF